MSINEIWQIPRIFTDNRERAYFLPVATFGFLYIFSAEPLYLVIFMIMSIVGVAGYFTSNLPSHDFDPDMPEALNNLIKVGVLSGHLLGVIFLIHIHSIEAGTIVVSDVLFIFLLFANVGYLSAFVIAVLFGW